MNATVTRTLTIAMALFLVGLVACSKAPQEVQSDASINNAIRAGFYSDPQLKAEPIEIAVNNGEVTLTGELSDDSVRMRAYNEAAGIPGVKKVNNLMQVKSPQNIGKSQAANQIKSEKGGKHSSSTSSMQEDSKAPVMPVAQATSATPAPPPPPQPRKVTIPVGTEVRIQMIDSVDSGKNIVGEKFQASLQAPIVVDDEVIVPKGTNIFVRLEEVKTSGKFKGRSDLQLALDHLEFQGKSYPLNSTTYEQAGESRGQDTVKKVGIGAAIGTAIGAIAGGRKGAAIGAGVGAGSGAAVQVFAKGKQVQVPSETKIDFKLEEPAQVNLMPGQGKKMQKQ